MIVVHVTTLEHPTTNQRHPRKSLLRASDSPVQTTCTRPRSRHRAGAMHSFASFACATLPETHVRPQVGNAPLLCRPMTATCEIVSLRLTLVRRAHAMDSTSQMATTFRVALRVPLQREPTRWRALVSPRTHFSVARPHETQKHTTGATSQ